jgi:hypothetical protein
MISPKPLASFANQGLLVSDPERVGKMYFSKIRTDLRRRIKTSDLLTDELIGMRRTANPGDSSDELEGLQSEKSDMSAGPAQQKIPPIEDRLQSLAESGEAVTVADLELIREAGLQHNEIRSLVPENPTENGNRLKSLAALLAQCFRLYGAEAGLSWLHQPLIRFGQKSPPRFSRLHVQLWGRR